MPDVPTTLLRVLSRTVSPIVRLLFSQECEQVHAVLDFRPSREVPGLLVHALIVAEDHRYLGHAGVDPIAVARATWTTAVLRRTQGGSTIEQQFVRTVTADYRRTLRRKVKEALLAMEVSTSFSKWSIAEAYLLKAYFGKGALGAYSAASSIGARMDGLGVEEAARLIASLKYPLAPTETEQRAELRQQRVNHILRRLQAASAYKSRVSNYALQLTWASLTLNPRS